MDTQVKTKEKKAGRFAYLDQEPDICLAPLPLSDFLLGPFDEARLDDEAPDFDLEDWCPPPLPYTKTEMQELLEWVDRERDKGDLYPDPDTYPFDDYFDREDLNVIPY